MDFKPSFTLSPEESELGLRLPIELSMRSLVKHEFAIPARAMWVQGQTREAVKMLLKGLSQFQDNPTLLFELGYIAQSAGDLVYAERFFNKIDRTISKNPDWTVLYADVHYESLFRLGQMALREGNPGAACKIFKAAARLGVSNKNSAHIAVAKLALRHGDLNEARTYIDRALALNDADPVAITVGVELLCKEGKESEAKRILQDLHRTHPDDAFIITKLGSIEIESNNFETARAYFQQAKRLRPDDTFIDYCFVKLLCLEGRFKEARPFIVTEIMKPNCDFRYIYLLALILPEDDSLWQVVESTVGSEHIRMFRQGRGRREEILRTLTASEDDFSNPLWDRAYVSQPVNRQAIRGTTHRDGRA